MTNHEETYRGYKIRVMHESLVHLELGRGLPCLTVAQARRIVDHYLDRTCAAHKSCTGDSMPEYRKFGVMAGVSA